MALLFRDGAGPIHEVEGVFKIRKLKYFVEMVLLDHLPIRQLRLERTQSFAFERRNVAAAGNAGLVG
jgi:hypothetical protein